MKDALAVSLGVVTDPCTGAVVFSLTTDMSKDSTLTLKSGSNSETQLLTKSQLIKLEMSGSLAEVEPSQS